MIRKLSWFWLLVLIFQACTNTHSPGASTVSGKISEADGQLIFLEELTVDDLIRIDSAVIDETGSFAFSYFPAEAGMFLLKLKDGEFVTIILNKGDHLEIEANISTFPGNYKISGNEDSEILEKYFTETAKRQKQLDSLSNIFRSSTHLKNFYQIKLNVDSAFVKIFLNQQIFTKQTINENPNSLACLLMINQRFGNKKLFTGDDDLELMMLVDSNLMKKYPGNSHVLGHHERVGKIIEKQKQQREADAKLSPGQPAPNLNLPDPSGKQISLNSLKGKFVLLFFWASYSPPCRADIQKLKEIYNQNKSNNFEVYAVSFDHNRKVWADVVKMENLVWINVSDLQGTKSPVKQLYNLPDELPYYYLISKKGKIISKGEKISNIEQVGVQQISHTTPKSP